MAVELATAYVDLVPSAKNIGTNIARELAPAQAAADDVGTKAGGRFSSGFMAKLAGIGAAIGATFAVGAAINFGKDIIAAASDVNESLSKVGVVFGDRANDIVGWSQTAATGLGMSQQKALEAAGTFGNLFSAMKIGQPAAVDMSKGVVQLAADLASFNNASPEDVLVALKSGLVGETEPLRRFGVNLSAARIEAKALEMGLAANKDELTAGAKAQAAYALITEDTALAQGDFARTSEGAANQQRIATAQWEDFQAKIGGFLLPIWTKLMSFITATVMPALTTFGNFVGGTIVPAVQALIAAFMDGGNDVTSSGLAGTFERIGIAARDIWDSITAVVDVLRNALGAAIGFVVDHFETFKTVLIAITAAFVAYKVIMTAVKIAQIIVTAAQIAWTIATNAGTIAQWALNAALTANPIGLVVAALVALVAAVVVAYLKVDWFRNIVDTAWDAIQVAISFAWNNVIKPIWTILAWYIENVLIRYIKLWWDIAVLAFQVISATITWAWNSVIQPIWTALADFITGTLVPFIQTLWDIGVAAWNAIATAVQWAWNNVIQPAWAAIQVGIDVLVSIFQTAQTIIAAVWSGISSAIQTAWGVMSPVFGFIGGAIDTMKAAFGTIGDAARAGFDALTGIVQGAFDGVRNLWNSTIGGFNIHIPGIPFTPFHGFDLTIPSLHTGGFVPGAPGSEVLALLQAGEFVVPVNEAQGAQTGPGRGAPAIGELHLHEVTDPYTAADLVAWKVRTAA